MHFFTLFKISFYKVNHYPEPSYSKNKIKVELDLSNYGSKYDAKEATCIDKSGFAKKSDVASLKSEVNKLDIDELEIVPTDLSKLSNLNIDVLKKTVYDEVVNKSNTIV